MTITTISILYFKNLCAFAEFPQQFSCGQPFDSGCQDPSFISITDCLSTDNVHFEEFSVHAHLQK